MAGARPETRLSPTDPALPDLLRMELAGRRLKSETIAARAGINARTLRDHLTGVRPVPPEEARRLRAALADLGPFLHPDTEAALVRRGDAHGGVEFLSGRDVPLRRVVVDTLWVVFDPHPKERAALQQVVEATFERARTRAPGIVWRYRRGGVLARPTWLRTMSGERQWKALTVQLAPWRIEDRRAVQDLLRALFAAQPGPFRFVPSFKIARIDVASDYAVSPAALLLNRPKARGFAMIEGSDGSATWYFGTRGRAGTLLRLYDGGARHPHDDLSAAGDWTRIEAEIRPKASVALDKLASAMSAMNPFPNFDVTLRVTEGLSLVEWALVDLVRQLGLPYVRRKLDRRDRARLTAALDKLRTGDARIETLGALGGQGGARGAPLTGWWEYVAEIAAHQLLFDPNAEASGEDWRWDAPELVDG